MSGLALTSRQTFYLFTMRRGRGENHLITGGEGGSHYQNDKSWEYLILTKTGLMMVSPRSPPVYVLRLIQFVKIFFNNKTSSYI